MDQNHKSEPAISPVVAVILLLATRHGGDGRSISYISYDESDTDRMIDLFTDMRRIVCPSPMPVEV